MIIEAAEHIVRKDEPIIKRFVVWYLTDVGVQIQLQEVLTKALFGAWGDVGTIPEGFTTIPQNMLNRALLNVITIGPIFSGPLEDLEPAFDLAQVINGAASFAFLVLYARLVDPAIIPPEVIPSDEVVDAMLRLFHVQRGLDPS